MESKAPESGLRSCPWLCWAVVFSSCTSSPWY